MTPNHPIPEDKKEEIQALSKRFNKGYVAKKLKIHVDTVKKYIKNDIDI